MYEVKLLALACVRKYRSLEKLKEKKVGFEGVFLGHLCNTLLACQHFKCRARSTLCTVNIPKPFLPTDARPQCPHAQAKNKAAAAKRKATKRGESNEERNVDPRAQVRVVPAVCRMNGPAFKNPG